MLQYCDIWKLNVNIEKTKVTIFERRRTNAQNTQFLFDGKEISVVPAFSYLGIILSFNGKMKECIEDRLDRGRRAMFLVLKKARTLNLPPDIQIDLFHKLVFPILSYGCEVWAYEDLDTIDKFHLKFLRYVLHLNNCTPIPMIYGETGEIPLSILLRSRMLGYLGKLLNPSSKTLAKQVFEVVHRMHLDRYHTTNWLYKIVSMLTEIGHVNVINEKIFIPPKVLTQVYKSHAKDSFVQRWRDKMTKLSKCDLYQLFKTDFEREKYLTELCPQGSPLRRPFCKRT